MAGGLDTSRLGDANIANRVMVVENRCIQLEDESAQLRAQASDLLEIVKVLIGESKSKKGKALIEGLFPAAAEAKADAAPEETKE